MEVVRIIPRLYRTGKKYAWNVGPFGLEIMETTSVVIVVADLHHTSLCYPSWKVQDRKQTTLLSELIFVYNIMLPNY